MFQSNDLTTASLFTGNFTIGANGRSQVITIPIHNDNFTETTEYFAVSTAVAVSPTITVNDTSKTPNYQIVVVPNTSSIAENKTITFQLTAPSAPVGARVPYLIQGITKEDVGSNTWINSGTFIIGANGKTSQIVSLKLSADNLTETETLTLSTQYTPLISVDILDRYTFNSIKLSTLVYSNDLVTTFTGASAGNTDAIPRAKTYYTLKAKTFYKIVVGGGNLGPFSFGNLNNEIGYRKYQEGGTFYFYADTAKIYTFSVGAGGGSGAAKGSFTIRVYEQINQFSELARIVDTPTTTTWTTTDSSKRVIMQTSKGVSYEITGPSGKVYIIHVPDAGSSVFQDFKHYYVLNDGGQVGNWSLVKTSGLWTTDVPDVNVLQEI